MKRLFGLVFVFLLAIGWIVYQSGGADPILSLPSALAAKSPSQTEQESSDSDAGGSHALSSAVWVATAYNIDYPSTQMTNADTLRQECDEILDGAAASGIGTIYFQVRPSCDAFYRSSLFPWSSYLTGTAGAAPEDDFDPLEYWVSAAHERGLRLEAWVNPYRICAGENAASDYAALPDSSPAKQHPDWVIQYSGGYYFDPGLPAVRDLIVSGVKEIVENYAVDGIQFDDYFYPGDDFDDSSTYATYGANFSDLSDWRRDNVNQLIQTVYQTVHSSAQTTSCVFGVSPSGIWKNGYGDSSGSKTSGYEHYSQSYADSMTWIQNGWVDYLCPQIYWEIGNSAADFETLVNWWSDAVDGTDTELIVGLAAYKIGSASDGATWESDGVNEISRQLSLCRSASNVSGVAVFSWSDLKNNSNLSDLLSKELS